MTTVQTIEDIAEAAVALDLTALVEQATGDVEGIRNGREGAMDEALGNLPQYREGYAEAMRQRDWATALPLLQTIDVLRESEGAFTPDDFDLHAVAVTLMDEMDPGEDTEESDAFRQYVIQGVVRRLMSLQQWEDAYGRAQELSDLIAQTAFASSPARLPMLAQTLFDLGIICVEIEQDAEAIDSYHTAAVVFSYCADHLGSAQSRYEMGLIYHRHRNYRRASDCYRDGYRDINMLDADEQGNPRYVAELNLLKRLGLAHHFLEEHDESRLWYRAALDLTRARGDESGLAQVMHSLGTVDHSAQVWDGAQGWYEAALNTSNNMTPPFYAQMVVEFHHLGTLSQARGDYAKAFEWLDLARSYSDQMGNQEGVANECRQIGLLLHQQDRWDEAEEFYRRAVDAYREADMTDGVARTYGQLAKVMEDKGELGDAIRYCARTAHMVSVNGVPLEEAVGEHSMRLRLLAGDDAFDRTWSDAMAAIESEQQVA